MPLDDGDIIDRELGALIEAHVTTAHKTDNRLDYQLSSLIVTAGGMLGSSIGKPEAIVLTEEEDDDVNETLEDIQEWSVNALALFLMRLGAAVLRSGQTARSVRQLEQIALEAGKRFEEGGTDERG